MRLLAAALVVSCVVTSLSCDSSTTSAKCQLVNETSDPLRGVLVVPWDAYCASSDCSERLPAATGGTSCGQRTDYPGCGFTTLTIATAGGPYIRVFDASGTLVGVQSGSDTGPYAGAGG